MNGLDNNMPPIWEHVQIFFDQSGFSELEARDFFQHYEHAHWRGPKGKPIRGWKTKAQEWMWAIKLEKPYLRSK